MQRAAEMFSKGSEADWRGAALACLAAFIGTFAAFLLAVVVIDPFDSGRFPTFMPPGSADDRAPTINVSRGRDPRFNALLLGSSTAVLVDPRRISTLTGHRVVEMAALGATVREQMAFLRWFARHRPRVDAVVIAADRTWCSTDPAMPGQRDFPYGLYGDSTFDYFKTTLSGRTLTFMRERVLFALGRMPGVDPESYYDSEVKLAGWAGVDVPAPRWTMTTATSPPVAPRPALDLLDATLKDVADDAAIVMWMPPVYRNELPPLGTVEALDLVGCKTALRDWTRRRTHATFVDFATDTPESADPGNFLDPIHVNNRYMRLLEPQIAAALNAVK